MEELVKLEAERGTPGYAANSGSGAEPAGDCVDVYEYVGGSGVL